MKHLFLLLIVVASIVACNTETTTGSTSAKAYPVNKDLTLDTDSESEKFSYSLGVLIGSDLRNAGIDTLDYGKVVQALDDSEENQIAYQIAASLARELNAEELPVSSLNKDILLKGIYDIVETDTTLMNGLEVNQAYQTFRQNNQIKVGEANLEAGKAFLENNKNVNGVVVAENGLQHILQEEGTGEKVGANDVLQVHYTGTTIDGEEFDSSRGGEPIPIDMADANSAIPGFMQSLTLYPIGSKYKVIIPSNLAYGAQRVSTNVGPNSTLMFDIEIVGKLDKAAAREHRAYVKQIQEQLRRQQQQRRQ